MLYYRFYTRSRKKNWQLNEIIHFLVWCHPKIAIIAQAWRLWSVTGRDTNAGRGTQRGKKDCWIFAVGSVLTLCQLKCVGCTATEYRTTFLCLRGRNLNRHSSTPLTFYCSQKQRQDRTWCGQTQEANDRLSNLAAEVQCNIWECTQTQLCNHIEPERCQWDSTAQKKQEHASFCKIISNVSKGCKYFFHKSAVLCAHLRWGRNYLHKHKSD